MKKLISICLALALALPALALAQSSQSQGSQTDQNNKTDQSQTTSKSKTMKGTVSHDQKSFKNDKDSKSYSVDNPDALQGEADQHVAVLVNVDPDTNTIHILQIEAPPQR